MLPLPIVHLIGIWMSYMLIQSALVTDFIGIILFSILLIYTSFVAISIQNRYKQIRKEMEEND